METSSRRLGTVLKAKRRLSPSETLQEAAPSLGEIILICEKTNKITIVSTKILDGGTVVV